MISPTSQGAVVVGVDAQGSAADAVCWAAAEAAAQRCPLRIVHAFRQPTLTASFGVPGAEVGFSWARTTAEGVLHEAAALARSIAPDTEVSSLLHFGAPSRALLREATDARLLVLGNRGQPGVRGPLTGSMSIRVSARARCPTVVIHTLPGVGAGTSPPRVVVGVDPTPSCAPAIGFAFRAARQRGLPLTALHACSPGAPVDFEAIRGNASLAAYAVSRMA